MPSPPAEPRPLLEALRTGAPLPHLPAQAVEQARALAQEPASAPPQAVEALPEPLALALLEGAVLAGNPALAEALSRSAHKALAKAARKALYKLRSRGVEVHEPAPAAPAPARPVPAGPEPLPALLTSIDGTTGERITVLGRPLPGGGVEALQLLLSDEHGVVRLDAATTSRGEYRRMLRSAVGPGPQGAVELPHAEALERLAVAVALNIHSRTPFPEGLEAALRHLGVEPQHSPPPIPPPEPDDERLSREGHTLHTQPELALWLPPDEELRRLVHRLEEVEVSPLQLSAVQRREQLLQLIHAQAHTWLASPQVRQRYARRLWDVGDYLERLGRPEPARVARAEARRLSHGVQEPPSRFVEVLYEKALTLQLSRRRGGAAEPPLPPQPGEPPHPLAPPGLPEPAEPPERRSKGGIILP